MHEQKLADLKELFLEIGKKFEEKCEINSINDIFEEIEIITEEEFDSDSLIIN